METLNLSQVAKELKSIAWQVTAFNEPAPLVTVVNHGPDQYSLIITAR